MPLWPATFATGILLSNSVWSLASSCLGNERCDDETSFLQTLVQQHSKRGLVDAGNSTDNLTAGLHIMVLTFNAGEEKIPEHSLAGSREFLSGVMQRRIEEASDPDIIMFASQGFRSGYFPLKHNMAAVSALSDYNHIGEFFDHGMDGKTSVEVAAKKHLSVPSEEDLRKTHESLLFGPYERRASMVRMRAEIGGMPFRFVGMDCGPGHSADAMRRLGVWVGTGSRINIIAGTYNTPVKASADTECGNKNSIREAFRIPSDDSPRQFFHSSGTIDGLMNLHSSSGLQAHMPFPPWTTMNGHKYFLPTYEFAHGCNNCDPATVMADGMQKLKCEIKNGALSMGFLDYFTVLYDGKKHRVSSGTLTWDGMPHSEHAMTTGVVHVSKVR